MAAKYAQLYASKYVPKDYDQRVQEVVLLMRARYGIKSRKKASQGGTTHLIVAARGTSASISTCSCSACAPSPIAPKPSSVGMPSASVRTCWVSSMLQNFGPHIEQKCATLAPSAGSVSS